MASRERVFSYFQLPVDEFSTHDDAKAFSRLLPHLLRLEVHDVAKLGPDSSEIVWLLREQASPPTRHRILSRWTFDLTHVPHFAQALLSSLGDELRQHPVLMESVRSALFQVAVRDVQRTDYSASTLRDLLSRHFGDLVRADPALSAAHEEDCARAALEREARKRDALRKEEEARVRKEQARVREEQRQAERLTRLAQISAMPLLERIRVLLTEGAGVDGPYPSEWTSVSDAEVSSLPTDVRLALVRELGSKRNRLYRELRRRLRAPEWAAQVEQREELASSLRELPLHLQLEHLATSSIPVGKYPTWVATRAIEGIATVPTELQTRVLARLTGQRRGIWRSLLEALRATTARARQE